MLDNADILSDLDQLRSRYQVLRHLGYDGGCAVYAVRGRGAEQHYLVKVMRKPGSGSAQAGTLHLWQAHTMERLDHPKLIPLHTVNHLQGGTLALAMERRRGPTLAERIESVGPLAVAEVESTLRDVAEALAYLHGRGVVHRGVGAESILLDRDSACARLAHFGIPRAERAGQAASDAASAGRAGGYDAPEQLGKGERAGGSDLTPRSDLYSLGLVGYAMLTGRELPTGDAAASSATEPLASLQSLRPDAPAYLCRAVEGCLERDPRRRWRDADEFLARLDPAAEDAAPAPRPELSGLWAELSTRLESISGALTDRWGSMPHRKAALALPAGLLVALAWAVVRPAGGSAPTAPHPAPVGTAQASHGASARADGAEPPGGVGGTLVAVTDLPALDPDESALPAPGSERQPHTGRATAPAPSAARGTGRSVRRAAPEPAPKSSAGGTVRRRPPPVPLLGEELASAKRGR